MNTFFILCGLPFAGKTTLTKNLVDRLGFVSVNIDDVKFAHGYEGVDDDDVPDKTWQEIYTDSYTQSKEALHAGKNVLYDSANLTRAIRDDVREHMKESGFPIKVLWFDIPADIVKERYRRNKETRERFDISEKLFQEALDTYEAPSENENVIIFREDIDLEKWISQLLEVDSLS